MQEQLYMHYTRRMQGIVGKPNEPSIYNIAI